MKIFFVLAAILAVSSADSCYNGVDTYCGYSGSDSELLKNCNAQYSAFKILSPELQTYANEHLMRSYEYLLMATHFGNYQKNRDGFSKLFRKLSDDTWGKTIELVKYVTKRGGKMDFNARTMLASALNPMIEPTELGFMAKALDTQKSLAERAHHIHGKATRHNKDSHDPEVGSYLEEEFMHEHAETIRQLAGHTTDLKRFVKDKDSSLSLFLFDEYLSKSG